MLYLMIEAMILLASFAIGLIFAICFLIYVWIQAGFNNRRRNPTEQRSVERADISLDPTLFNAIETNFDEEQCVVCSESMNGSSAGIRLP
jgi:hypothetical protein